MAKWRKDSNPTLPLSKLDHIRSRDDKGAVTFHGLYLDDFLTLLCHCVDYDSAVPQMRHRALCRTALFSHNALAPFTPASFLPELNAAERALLKGSRDAFWIRTSISIRRLPNRQRGALRQMHYSIDPHYGPIDPPLTKMLERIEQILGVKELPRNYLPVWIRSSGYDIHDAGLNAIDCFDALRGIWNFCVNVDSRRSSSGRPKPVNPIVLGPVHVMYDQHRMLMERGWLYDPGYVLPVRPYDVAATWQRTRTNEAIIRQSLKGRWYSDLITAAFRRYARALDDCRHEISFLGLWGVLEMLTLTQRAKYDDTITRASLVFTEPEYIRRLLDALRDERNEFVHASIAFEDAEVCLYQLKSVVEGLFQFWLGAARSLRSEEEARMFLQLSGSVNALRRRKAILDVAIRFHQG